MEIVKYEYKDPSEPGWHFSGVEFNKINLLVSNSGMGKTRILNTIFNLGTQISSKKLKAGIWDLSLDINGIRYEWELEAKILEGKEPEVILENLKRIDEREETVLVRRNSREFFFKDKLLPKLPKNVSSISLLGEEPDIKPLFEGFAKILRRRFFEADLSERCKIGGFPFGFLEEIKSIKKVAELYPELQSGDLSLHSIMLILNRNFPSIFSKICDYFQSIFSFITEIKVLDLQELNEKIKIPKGQVPVFCIKEKGVSKWLPLNELSSGMQKVLLILTDVFTLPDGSIYLVDEYENSLGMNSINFFPNLLIEEDFNIQFFITSHHPYIINKIPIENWYVFHRTGSEVNILYGDKVTSRFGVSKQQAYIKLLNDSFFLEGKE